ncbi:MAG: beta-ketoacyl-[acyl-carrier-protein] synthase family protein [Candidatus Omnitrophica bacterium]|nr:beta-ketoacyl-[acyl-carrier-protein] synthase family protein [Candidatus Omnitrophota bacterium]
MDVKLNRVVITGIGCVTPIGNNAREFSVSLKKGIVGAGKIVRSPQEPPINGRAFQIQNFSPPKHSAILDPFIQYILAATEEALQDSGLVPTEIDRERLGIAVSSSKGGMRTFERFYERFQKNKSALLGARVYANFIPNIASQWVARHWKISGPAKPVVAACATGLYALMEGIRMIEQDEVDYCIAGAGDASLTQLMWAGYRNMGVFAKDQMRPFDKRRDGFLIGEGAGIVILEKLESAKARRAKIYGTVLAHKYGFEGSHPISFSEDGDGLKHCLSELLKQAKMAPKDIDYLNLHGTATRRGDLYETKQIKTAFGKEAYQIPMSATKSMVGHMLGASGAVEVIACLIAMRDGFIPPTANLEQPDPECNLDYTPKVSKPKAIKISCSVSIGFGGHLGAIILEKGNRQ